MKWIFLVFIWILVIPLHAQISAGVSGGRTFPKFFSLSEISGIESEYKFGYGYISGIFYNDKISDKIRFNLGIYFKNEILPAKVSEQNGIKGRSYIEGSYNLKKISTEFAYNFLLAGNSKFNLLFPFGLNADFNLSTTLTGSGYEIGPKEIHHPQYGNITVWEQKKTEYQSEKVKNVSSPLISLISGFKLQFNTNKNWSFISEVKCLAGLNNYLSIQVTGGVAYKISNITLFGKVPEE